VFRSENVSFLLTVATSVALLPSSGKIKYEEYVGATVLMLITGDRHSSVCSAEQNMFRIFIFCLMTEVEAVEFFVLTKRGDGESPIFLPVK
jgi:hypothetical protein